MNKITSLFNRQGSKDAKIGELKKSNDFNVLVIDGNKSHDWKSIFREAGVGENVKIHQGGWKQLSFACYSTPHNGVVAQATLVLSNNANDGTTISHHGKKSFQVHFCLIREECRGATPQSDMRNNLYALKYANVPAVNSLDTVLLFLERPVVFGELNAIRSRHGQEEFPLIEQTYYSTAAEMLVTPQAPTVMKLGHAHAGAGKLKLPSHRDVEDWRSVVMMTDFYCTAEPFVSDAKYDLRIQRIGDQVRAYRRIGISGSWKTNTGACIIESVDEGSPEYARYVAWTDWVQAELFGGRGGMDIFAVDAIVYPDGREAILEINSSSIGLAPDMEQVDLAKIAELVANRIQEEPNFK